MRLRGIQIYISPGNFEKSSCLSPLFLHYDSHFNPPSLIKRNFATRGGGARARARARGGGGVAFAPIAPPLPTALQFYNMHIVNIFYIAHAMASLVTLLRKSNAM